MPEWFPFPLLPWPDQTFAVTPSDSSDLALPADALEIVTGGNLSVVTPAGQTLNLTGVSAG